MRKDGFEAESGIRREDCFHRKNASGLSHLLTKGQADLLKILFSGALKTDSEFLFIFYHLRQVCQSQIHRGPKKQIGYNPRAGLVQCLLKQIEMIARSLLNQDLTLCII